MSLLLTLFLLVLATGCKSQSLTVSLDPQIEKTAYVPVHLVGVSEANRKQWETMDMAVYFKNVDKKDEALNAAVQRTVNLDSKTPSVTISGDDPIWTQWKDSGASYIFVLANWPRNQMLQSKPGSADPRRRILFLDRSAYDADKIDVVVREHGLDIPTRMTRSLP